MDKNISRNAQRDLDQNPPLEAGRSGNFGEDFALTRESRSAIYIPHLFRQMIPCIS
jgi:hypothetical protein